MNRVNVKAISVNEAWRGGRRFKTALYKAFEEEMMYSLPKLKVPPGKLFLRLEFGLSNKRADVDNYCKGTIDCLQTKYDFNDNRIYGMEVWKEDVKRGEEYIEFELSALE